MKIIHSKKDAKNTTKGGELIKQKRLAKEAALKKLGL